MTDDCHSQMRDAEKKHLHCGSPNQTFCICRLDGVPYYHIIRLILPDVAVLVVSIIVFVISSMLIRRDSHEEADLPLTNSYIRRKHKMASALNYLGEFFVGLLLAASSIMIPSVSSQWLSLCCCLSLLVSVSLPVFMLSVSGSCIHDF